MKDYRAILTQALGSPHGLAVKTTSPERLRVKLYNAKRKHLPTYDSLSFVFSPTDPNNTLWIIHNGK